MFGYEHERVCFARIGECDGGMSATIGSKPNIIPRPRSQGPKTILI